MMFLPSRCGVYLLEHAATGHCYVGSSTRLPERREFWLKIIASLSESPWQGGDGPQVICGVVVGAGKCRMTGSLLNGAALGPRLEAGLRRCGSLGWSWSVLHWLDDWAPPEVIWRAELLAIEAAWARAGDRCLNRTRRPPSNLGGYDSRCAGSPACRVRRR